MRSGPDDSGDHSLRSILLFFGTAICALAADQLAKFVVVSVVSRGRSVVLIPGVLRITHSSNKGAAFGLLSESGHIVFLIALGVVLLTIGIFLWNRGLSSGSYAVALGLIVGGAVGNLADRLLRGGEVVDFIDVGWWPVFNLADVAIVVGAIIFVMVTIFEIRKRSVEADETD
jgi:signal peptidase II